MSKLKLFVVLQLVVSCVIVAPLAADTNADISVKSITVAKSKVNVFEALKVSAVVGNSGNNELKGVVVGLSLINPPKVVEEYSVNLPPNSDIGLYWTTFLPVGTHGIAVIADTNNAIEESDEQNNVRTHQVTVEPIPLSEEAIQHIRKVWRNKAPGDKLGPFVVLKPIRADLYPDLGSAGGVTHIRVYVRTDGPDTLPQEVADLVTVTVEFIGAPTDHICTASLKGQTSSWGSALAYIDFYTESTGPCPRALVESVPCTQPQEGSLYFMCTVIPDLRISVNLPTSKELFYTGHLLIDPKPYNNISIEKAGKY